MSAAQNAGRMGPMKLPDRARVTTFVSVTPQDAFEVFTNEIDLWWKRGVRFRFDRPDADGADGTRGVLRFEGSERLVESRGGANPKEFEVGRVLAWEPGARLVFEWRANNFAPGEVTEVEVRFEPMNEGTQVTLEHRGWSKLRPDHPVRHGQQGHVFTDPIGQWWGELAMSFRLHVARKCTSDRD